MDMSLNRSASSSEHPWTDADANLHSVTDMDTPHLSRELHVRDECHRLWFSMESHFVFLYFTGNMLSNAKAHSKFLPCSPSPKCVTVWLLMLINWYLWLQMQICRHGQMWTPKCQHPYILWYSMK